MTQWNESEQTPGDSEGREGLVCCSSWGRKESGIHIIEFLYSFYFLLLFFLFPLLFSPSAFCMFSLHIFLQCLKVEG